MGKVKQPESSLDPELRSAVAWLIAGVLMATVTIMLLGGLRISARHQESGALESKIVDLQQFVFAHDRKFPFSWPLKIDEIELDFVDIVSPADPRCTSTSCFLAGIHTKGLESGSVLDVLAARSGRVVFCGEDEDGIAVVRIAHDLGYQTVYGELEEIKTRLHERVEERQVIATAKVASPVCFSFGVIEPGKQRPSSDPTTLLPKIPGLKTRPATRPHPHEG